LIAPLNAGTEEDGGRVWVNLPVTPMECPKINKAKKLYIGLQLFVKG
jgi:hypothetical protein